MLWWLAPVHPMARLSLTLFGGFRARFDPDQALVIAIKKSQALLAYLALPLGQAHPRDKLAALLWGDMQEAQARAGLRQTLYTLRKVLGDLPLHLRFDPQLGDRTEGKAEPYRSELMLED